MKINKNLFVLIIILFACIPLLSGCTDTITRSIDTLGYVVGIGVDIGENDVLKLSFQIATPASSQGGSSSKGGSSSSSTSESSTYIINTVECNSVDTGLNLINSHISKNLNLSHCKVIVFSE